MPKIPYCEKLIGTMGYSDKPMIPPPCERGPNAVQFELTTGCSHGRCTFCDMYGGVDNYREKSLAEFKEHVELVLRSIKPETRLEKIFIGGGNALTVDTEKLSAAIQYSAQSLVGVGYRPRKISIYGNTLDILKHGNEGMGVLKSKKNEFGLEMVYWGLESGNDEVLKIASKGYDSNQAVKAGKILKKSHYDSSIMIMPGLGGMAYFDKHVRDTVRVLNHTRPHWITFMGLKIKPNTPYETWMKRQEELNKNRNLTPYEVCEQTAQIIEKLDFPTSIGIHGDDVHEGLCFNPVHMGIKHVHYEGRKRLTAEDFRYNMSWIFGELPTSKKRIFDFLRK